VDVVGFAVELPQLRLELAAHLPHDLFASLEHGFIEHASPVFGDEHQVRVKVVGDVTAGANIRVWFPAW
jgi:hypothetical protein